MIVLAVLPRAPGSRRPGWSLVGLHGLLYPVLADRRRSTRPSRSPRWPPATALRLVAWTAPRRARAAALVSPVVAGQPRLQRPRTAVAAETPKNLGLRAPPAAAGAAVHGTGGTTSTRWSTGPRRPSGPVRRRPGAASTRSGCASPATCTTWSPTRWSPSTSRPAWRAHVRDPDPETNRATFRDIKQGQRRGARRPAHDARGARAGAAEDAGRTDPRRPGAWRLDDLRGGAAHGRDRGRPRLDPATAHRRRCSVTRRHTGSCRRRSPT